VTKRVFSDARSWIAGNWARFPSVRTVAGWVYRSIRRKLAHPFAPSWTVRRLSDLPAKIIRRFRRLVAFATRLSRSLMNRWSRSEAARRLERSQTLHTVACGDFTLLSREDWFRLQGYPEWPIFSWHVDSVLMFAASANDIKEVSLGGKYRIYHIDHSIGSGWSAAGEKLLFARLEKKGIPYLSNDDVRRLQKVFANEPSRSIFNGENWGLGNRPLPEREIFPAMRVTSKSEAKTDLPRPTVRSVGSSCHERV
jgi:hypothetical protein